VAALHISIDPEVNVGRLPLIMRHAVSSERATINFRQKLVRFQIHSVMYL